MRFNKQDWLEMTGGAVHRTGSPLRPTRNQLEALAKAKGGSLKTASAAKSAPAAKPQTKPGTPHAKPVTPAKSSSPAVRRDAGPRTFKDAINSDLSIAEVLRRADRGDFKIPETIFEARWIAGLDCVEIARCQHAGLLGFR